MKGLLTNIFQLITQEKVNNVLNLPMLIITLLILLSALWLCIAISKKNKLYIKNKKDMEDKSFT